MAREKMNPSPLQAAGYEGGPRYEMCRLRRRTLIASYILATSCEVLRTCVIKQNLIQRIKNKEELARTFEMVDSTDQYFSGEHHAIEAHTPLELAQKLKVDIEFNYERVILSIINRVLTSKAIKKFFLEKGWSLPDVKIINGFNDIQEMVDEFRPNIDTQFWEKRRVAANNSHDTAVIFELPKPLAINCFKGNDDEQNNPDKIAGVPWGTIYRQSMSSIWESIGYFSSETSNYLNIYRLNNYGDHKPGKYYYIWYLYIEK